MPAQFLSAAAYPTITVEIGVADTTSAGGTWGQSVWDTGTWTDDIAWTDISAYVRALSTDWARSRDLNRQPANVLNLTLDNRDGRFSPGNTAGPFVVAGVSKIRPRVAVRVQATWSSVVYPIYYGFVTNWQDSLPSVGKDLVTTVQATDALSLLTLNAVDGSAIGSNGDTCAARIRAILTAAAWPLGSRLDPGTNTLTVDSTADSALTLLQNVAQSEGGLVYADVDGTLTFHGQTRRSGGTIGTSTSSVFISTTIGASKTWTTQANLPFAVGDRLHCYNPVDTWKSLTITVTSYSGTTLTGTVVAYGGNGFTPTSWNIQFTDSTTATITFGPSNSPYDEPQLSNDETYFYNAVTVVPQGEQSGTSSTSVTIATGSKAFTTQAGLGLAVGNTLLIASTANSANFMQGNITAYSGTSMTVDVTSTGGSGTIASWAISLVGSVTATATDGDSISLYSTRALSVDSWATNTQASALATFLLGVYAEPEYRVDSVRVTPATSPSTLWPLVLDATIDDLHSVTVPLPITTYASSIVRTVHVAGISHSITPGDGWRVTFTYSSATPY